MVLYPEKVSIIMAATESVFGAGYTLGKLEYSLNLCTAYKTRRQFAGPAIGSVLYSLGGFGVPFWTVGSVGLVCAVLIFFLLPSVKAKDNIDSSDGNGTRPLTPRAVFSVRFLKFFVQKISSSITPLCFYSLHKYCSHFSTTLSLSMAMACLKHCWSPT